MILRYTVDDFPVNSGVVYPPPPPPRKETDHGQLRGLRFQYGELREDSGRGGAPAAQPGVGGGGRRGPNGGKGVTCWMRLLLLRCSAWTVSGMPLPFPNTCVLCCDIPTFGTGCPSPNVWYRLMLGERGALSRLRLDPQRWLHVCVTCLWGFLFSHQAALGTLTSWGGRAAVGLVTDCPGQLWPEKKALRIPSKDFGTSRPDESQAAPILAW